MTVIKSLLPLFEIVLAILLSGAILLQQRGTGLSATFGGGDGNIYRTKRGVEKIVFNATIVLAIALFAAAILNIVLSRAGI